MTLDGHPLVVCTLYPTALAGYTLLCSNNGRKWHSRLVINGDYYDYASAHHRCWYAFLCWQKVGVCWWLWLGYPGLNHNMHVHVWWLGSGQGEHPFIMRALNCTERLYIMCTCVYFVCTSMFKLFRRIWILSDCLIATMKNFSGADICVYIVPYPLIKGRSCFCEAMKETEEHVHARHTGCRLHRRYAHLQTTWQLLIFDTHNKPLDTRLDPRKDLYVPSERCMEVHSPAVSGNVKRENVVARDGALLCSYVSFLYNQSWL